jgi:xylulokinase
MTTDRGDASGTGYWSPATGDYRPELLELALGQVPRLPRALGPRESAGHTPAGMLLGPGTGDNMAAALGVGARPGDVIVSIGTSGTVFAVHDQPSADASGIVAGFADATGRYLPLVCTLNAARVLSATAALLGVGLGGLDDLALSAPPGAEGVVLVPYFEGERTPNRPDATGQLAGLRLHNTTPANLARAAVEGMLCGLADGLDALRDQGVAVDRVLLIGGGARSRAVQAVAPSLLDAPVLVPPAGEYVAGGAARQAAWVLSGDPEPPDWSATTAPQPVHGDPTPQVREAYAEARDQGRHPGSS